MSGLQGRQCGPLLRSAEAGEDGCPPSHSTSPDRPLPSCAVNPSLSLGCGCCQRPPLLVQRLTRRRVQSTAGREMGEREDSGVRGQRGRGRKGRREVEASLLRVGWWWRW